jgi:hypothetical protein
MASARVPDALQASSSKLSHASPHGFAPISVGEYFVKTATLAFQSQD